MEGAMSMSRQSGFVPIPFQLVGKILLAIGLAGSVLVIVSRMGSLYSLPLIVTLFSLAAIILGLYLIFVVPRESL